MMIYPSPDSQREQEHILVTGYLSNLLIAGKNGTLFS